MRPIAMLISGGASAGLGPCRQPFLAGQTSGLSPGRRRSPLGRSLPPAPNPARIGARGALSLGPTSFAVSQDAHAMIRCRYLIALGLFALIVGQELDSCPKAHAAVAPPAIEETQPAPAAGDGTAAPSDRVSRMEGKLG